MIIDGNFDHYRGEILEAISAGKVFIYPTDTIYGIGCDATNEAAVSRIRKIKKRDTKPFSVIAPGKEWIRKNCVIPEDFSLEILPGPYTLICKLINKQAVDNGVNPGINSLGVRIPKHWFGSLVEEAGVPFVTTSVNISGLAHMERMSDLSESFIAQVDIIIYEGEIHGKPSEKIFLTDDNRAEK